jgi:glycosyltransferase involved in cell wall biosynthesis
MTTAHRSLHSLFVVPRYWPALGGAEQHTRRLAQQIADRVKVSVVSHCSLEPQPPELAYAYNSSEVGSDGDTAIHQLAATGVPRRLLQRLAPWHPRQRLVRPLYAAVQKYNLRVQLDSLVRGVGLVHAVYNGSTATVEAAADAAQRAGIPFVLTPLAHTTLKPGTAWSSQQFRRLYQRATALITMTDYERDWLAAQGAARNRIHVCPVAPLLNGEPDPQGFRARYGLGDKPFVLFIGRLVEYKGYRVLAEAGRVMWQRHPDAQIVYIGPHSAASRGWLDTLDEPRIRHLGVITDAEKSSALAACSLLCVPSTEESLGVTYLEAWSFGKPVVAADIPVLRTVISHQRDGLLCAPRPQGIADALNQLLARPAWAAELGAEGRKKVNTLYDWARIGDRLSDIYRVCTQR